MQRFFVDPELNLTLGAEIALPPTVAHQVGHVLRLHPGDRILLLDDSGDECEVELVAFERSAIRGRVRVRRPGPGEDGPQITLYQCMLKGEKFGWVLQKATELGVAAVVPVAAARCVAPPAEMRAAGKQERWERIIREAAEQSRRGRRPRLHAPLAWAAAVAQAAAADLALVPWEEATREPGLGTWRAAAQQAARVALFIGPEGGLTAAEVAAARAAGVRPVSLGAHILRAETAALAALAVLRIP